MEKQYLVMARVPDSIGLWLIQLRRNVQDLLGLQPKDLPRLRSSGFGFALLPPDHYDPVKLDASVRAVVDGHVPPLLSLADLVSIETEICVTCCGETDSLKSLGDALDMRTASEFQLEPRIGIFRQCSASQVERLHTAAKQAAEQMSKPAPFLLKELVVMERRHYMDNWHAWTEPFTLTGNRDVAA